MTRLSDERIAEIEATGCALGDRQGEWVENHLAIPADDEALDGAQAIRDLLAERDEREGWTPMSEAPTDGTEIEAIVGVYVSGTSQFIRWDRHIIAFDQELGEMGIEYDTGWAWDAYEFFRRLGPLPEAPHG